MLDLIRKDTPLPDAKHSWLGIEQAGSKLPDLIRKGAPLPDAKHSWLGIGQPGRKRLDLGSKATPFELHAGNCISASMSTGNGIDLLPA